MFSETKLSVSIFVKSYNIYNVCIEQHNIAYIRAMVAILVFIIALAPGIKLKLDLGVYLHLMRWGHTETSAIQTPST